MGFILRGIACRSALCFSDRGCRRGAIIVGLKLPKQTPQQPKISSWYHKKCHYSLDAKNPTDTKNSVIRTITIQEREDKLLELLKTPQIRNQNYDLVTEYQTILLYYCNQVTLNNNSNKAETTLAAQNICKWTQAMLNYLRNEQQDRQEKNTITHYSSVPWEPIVEALSSTHQILFLTFANDLVLTLAASLSNQKSIAIDTTKLMSCLICGWSKCCSNISNRSCEPAEKAEKWLLDWIRNYYYHEQKEELEFPNILLFGAVIDSWAKSTKREAPFRAERILNLLLFFANKEKSNITRSNSELQRSSTIKQLISLLEDEKPLFFYCLLNNKVINGQSSKKYGNVVQRPNAVLYTSIIDAWSRSSHPMAANYAEQWLHHMEKEYYEYGNADARPNVVSYTAVISAFARCSSHPQKNTNNKTPHTPHAANRSESVLLRLLQLSTRECDEAGGNSVQTTAQQLTPDVMAYNSVISAWANTVGKDPLATKNSERWLKILLEEGGAAEADAVSFNSVINAYAREATYNGSKAAKRAEQWFMDMKIRGIEPTTITYGSLIKAWSNSRSPEAPERAEFWLQAYRQQQQQQVGHNRQDAIIVYNSAVNAWATSGRSDSLDGAIRLISEMENGGSNLRQKLLDAPSTLYKFTPPPPDTITYNTLLKGCSSFPGGGSNKVKNGPTHSKLHEKALSIAFKTYNHMLISSSSRSSRVQPDSHTFSIILSCISRQTPYAEKRNNPSYKEIIAKIFHDCCTLGMVNDIVLSALKNACSCLPDEGISNKFFTELTTDNFTTKNSDGVVSSSSKDDYNTITSIHNIPAQWKINVHAGGGLGRSQAPTERAMLLSRQKKNVFRSSNP